MKYNKAVVLLLIILAAGIFLRFQNLTWENFGFGEVEVYQAVQEFQTGDLTKNFFIFAETPLMKYLSTVFAFIFSPAELALRLLSAIFGSLTILMIFVFARKLYNNRVALLAAMFTAFSLIHVQMSRYVQFEAAIAFFYVLLFYLFWEFLQKQTNKNAVLLGITMALGILAKTVFLNAVVTLIILALIYKIIIIKIRPNFTISINNKFIKAVIVSIAAFFIIWPLALFPLSTEITVDVEGRVNHISTEIPTILLVFGYRATEISLASTDSLLLSIPIIGHFFFFLAKESLLFIVLFLAGLYAMRKVRKPDTYIFIITFLFFALFWAQDVRFTYRYIAIIIPFLAVIAANSIRLVEPMLKKKHALQYIAALVLFVLLFAQAFVAAPSYALHYNSLNNVLQLPESEGRFGEGVRGMVEGLEGCESFMAGGFYVFTIKNYLDLELSDSPDCVVKGINDGMQNDEAIEYLENHDCTIKETVTKNGIDLIEIYSC